jgi:hypothetical protein
VAVNEYQPSQERRRSVVGPAILIGLGLLFLGQNMGLLSGDVWFTLWRFWPVLLILGGVELIFGRSNWASAVVVALVLLVVGAAVVLPSTAVRLPWINVTASAAVPGPGAVDRVVEPLDGASKATIELRHSAGRLTVAGLPAGSPLLIDAELPRRTDSPVDQRIRRNGAEVDVLLRDPERRSYPIFANSYVEHWQVYLSPSVATSLKVDTGASAFDLDLRPLRITDLQIKTGASGVKVQLPEAAGRTQARIKAGAAGVEVVVPQGVAARISTKGGLAGIDIDEGRFPRSGSYYLSPDYNTAQNRVDLEIDAGVSGVTVR